MAGQADIRAEPNPQKLDRARTPRPAGVGHLVLADAERDVARKRDRVDVTGQVAKTDPDERSRRSRRRSFEPAARAHEAQLEREVRNEAPRDAGAHVGLQREPGADEVAGGLNPRASGGRLWIVDVEAPAEGDKTGSGAEPKRVFGRVPAFGVRKPRRAPWWRRVGVLPRRRGGRGWC